MAASNVEQSARDEMRAWTSGEFDTVRRLVDDDVTFVGAMGTTNGADEYIAGLQGLAKIVTGIDIKKVFVDGDDVCVVYDLNTEPAPVVPCVALYRFKADKIASKRVFFDPRPLLPPDHS